MTWICFSPNWAARLQCTVRGAAKLEKVSPLAKVNPRAGLGLPHPALGSNVGGPLPLHVQADQENTPEKASFTCQLLLPRFTGAVFLFANAKQFAACRTSRHRAVCRRNRNYW